MSEHLGDSAFAAWALDAGEREALDHLSACGECRKEAVDLRRRLAAFREAIHAAGERTEVEWRGQAAEEGVARKSAPRRALLRWVPATGLAAIALVVALVTRAPKRAPPPASNDAADNALLLAIQSDLSRQAPAALAPAETLVARANPSKSSQ